MAKCGICGHMLIDGSYLNPKSHSVGCTRYLKDDDELAEFLMEEVQKYGDEKEGQETQG